MLGSGASSLDGGGRGRESLAADGENKPQQAKSPLAEGGLCNPPASRPSRRRRDGKQAARTTLTHVARRRAAGCLRGDSAGQGRASSCGRSAAPQRGGSGGAGWLPLATGDGERAGGRGRASRGGRAGAARSRRVVVGAGLASPFPPALASAFGRLQRQGKLSLARKRAPEARGADRSRDSPGALLFLSPCACAKQPANAAAMCLLGL